MWAVKDKTRNFPGDTSRSDNQGSQCCNNPGFVWRKSKKGLRKHESHSGLFKIGLILRDVIKMQVKVNKNFPTRDTSEPQPNIKTSPASKP